MGNSRKKVKLFSVGPEELRHCILHKSLSFTTYPKHQIHQNDEKFNDRTARIHFSLCFFRFAFEIHKFSDFLHKRFFFYYQPKLFPPSQIFHNFFSLTFFSFPLITKLFALPQPKDPNVYKRLKRRNNECMLDEGTRAKRMKRERGACSMFSLDVFSELHQNFMKKKSLF